MSLNPDKARYARYNIMIKLVSDMREVGGFLPVLRVLRFPQNKTYRHYINDILLKVALNTITITPQSETGYFNGFYFFFSFIQLNTNLYWIYYLNEIVIKCN